MATDKARMEEHAAKHIQNSIDSIKDIWDTADSDMRRKIKSDMAKLVDGMSG